MVYSPANQIECKSDFVSKGKEKMVQQQARREEGWAEGGGDNTFDDVQNDCVALRCTGCMNGHHKKKQVMGCTNVFVFCNIWGVELVTLRGNFFRTSNFSFTSTYVPDNLYYETCWHQHVSYLSTYLMNMQVQARNIFFTSQYTMHKDT